VRTYTCGGSGLTLELFPEAGFTRNYDTGLGSTEVYVRAAMDEETPLLQGLIIRHQPQSQSLPNYPPISLNPRYSSSTASNYGQHQSLRKGINDLLSSRAHDRLLRLLYSFLIFAAVSFAVVSGYPVCVLNTNASIYHLPPYNITPEINNLFDVPALITTRHSSNDIDHQSNEQPQ
jgi:hypothetical protein